MPTSHIANRSTTSRRDIRRVDRSLRRRADKGRAGTRDSQTTHN